MKTVYDYIRFEKYSKKNKDSSFDFVPFQTRDSWNESTYIYVRFFFCQVTTFIKVHLAIVFGLHTLWLKDFSKIYQLKGLKSKKQLPDDEKLYLIYANLIF